MLLWCLLGIAGTKLASLELLLAPRCCCCCPWRLSIAQACLHAARILSKQNMEFLIVDRNTHLVFFSLVEK